MSVNKIVFSMLAISMLFGFLYAQSNGDYRTVTSAIGTWSTVSNWEVYNGGWGAASGSPTSADGQITIRSDASIALDANVTVDQLVIEGILTVNSGKTLSTNDGTGAEITLNGTLLHQGTVANPMNGTGIINAGSIYIHNTTGSAARMVDFFSTKSATSTWIYRGSSTLNTSLSLAGKTFGNLELESVSGTWSPSWAGTSITTVNGNFKIGTGVNLTITSTAANVFKGNYTINGAITYGTGTQNFSFQGTGNTIGGSGAVQFETAAIAAAGSYTLASQIEVLSGFTFSVTGTLNCGGNTIIGAGNFVVAAGSTFKICHPNGINGNVLVTGTKTYSTSANYEFNGSVNQVTGSGFPVVVNNLTINNPNTITLSSSISISGSLNFLQGYLDLGNNSLTGSGTVTGNPEIIYSGTGIATAVGTNTDAIVRTLSPTVIPANINNLIVEVGAGNNFLLPNDVTFNTVTFTSGGIILNHNVLTVAGMDLNIHVPNTTTYLNALTVTKTNTPASQGGGNQSISRLWNITGNSSGPLDITLSWPTPAADTGIIFTNDKGKVWRYGTSWVLLGEEDIITNVNIRSLTFAYTLGAKDASGDFTVTGDGQTLPVELSSFTAILNSENYVNLAWISQSESDLSGYYVYRHVRNELSSAVRVSDLIPATNSSNESVYNYIDEEVENNTTYYYWLEASELNNTSLFHGPISVVIGNGGEVIPPPIIDTYTMIESIYPNPFNPRTEIVYNIKDATDVTIGIYNIKGQMIRQLVSGQRTSGYYKVAWDGMDQNGQECRSGVYYVRLQADHILSTKKMVLVK